MSKATISLVTLALLVLCDAASAVNVRLVAHNQRSSSGTLSTLKWAATCTPLTTSDPCISSTNPWTIANAQPSDAVWTWDPATGILASTGTFQTTSHIGSNANATAVISDKVTDLSINTMAMTATASAYECVEGNFLGNVGAHGCANLNIGPDFTYNSSMAYNVGGNANCVQRTIAGDDFSTGNPRGLVTASGVPGCDDVDGAFDLFTVLQDLTATGGQLIIGGNTPITDAGANYLTFDVGPTAVDDAASALQAVATPIDVLANDLAFTDPVDVTISTPPTKGTAVVTGTSPGPKAGITITYTSNVGATGTDTFVYSVLDGDGTTTDTATVTVTILAGGANDDAASTTRNHAAITINVGANDTGLTDPVSIAIISAPDAGGTAVAGADGPAATATVTYTPATTAPGTATYTETFTYQLTDANLTVVSANVTVTVSNSVPVANTGNIAVSTGGIAPASASGTFNALTGAAGNSAGNTPATITATNGANGTTSVSGNVVTYTPGAAFFTGSDSYTYTITDSDPGTPDSATGTVNVTIADLTPALADGTITTTQDTASAAKALVITAGNGSVAQHTLAVSTQATNGSCALSGTSVVYTPAAGYTGADSCVVTITDENGAGQSDTGTLSITINAAAAGGGPGGLLPGGGGGAVDLWSLALLAGAPWLRRLRRSVRGQAISGNQG